MCRIRFFLILVHRAVYVFLCLYVQAMHMCPPNVCWCSHVSPVRGVIHAQGFEEPHWLTKRACADVQHRCECDIANGFTDKPYEGGFCTLFYILNEDINRLPNDFEDRTPIVRRVRARMHTHVAIWLGHMRSHMWSISAHLCVYNK